MTTRTRAAAAPTTPWRSRIVGVGEEAPDDPLRFSSMRRAYALPLTGRSSPAQLAVVHKEVTAP